MISRVIWFKMGRIGSLCGLYRNTAIRWYSVVFCWRLRVILDLVGSLEVDISVVDHELLMRW